MNEDERMFQWGVGLVIAVLLLTASLQLCYRVQDRNRARTRAEIVRTQQEIAVASANFASYVRPEILRNLVISIYPKSEVVSFKKSISVEQLP